jgi:hypothetical protein
MKRVTKTGEISVASDIGRNSLGGLTSAITAIPEDYPFRLNTYAIPPNYDITVEQFEEYSYARLQCTSKCPPR